MWLGDSAEVAQTLAEEIQVTRIPVDHFVKIVSALLPLYSEAVVQSSVTPCTSII